MCKDTIAVIVTLHVKPGRAGEFLAALAPVLDAMRHEPTFINAVLHRDPEDPDRFMLYETWADRSELVEVQMGRAYRKPYMDRLPELLAEPRQVQVFQPLRGDFRFTYSGATESASQTTAA
jgi:quinol monooxygenase YgiN